jgi:hypothetical protein
MEQSPKKTMDHPGMLAMRQFLTGQDVTSPPELLPKGIEEKCAEVNQYQRPVALYLTTNQRLDGLLGTWIENGRERIRKSDDAFHDELRNDGLEWKIGHQREDEQPNRPKPIISIHPTQSKTVFEGCPSPCMACQSIRYERGTKQQHEWDKKGDIETHIFGKAPSEEVWYQAVNAYNEQDGRDAKEERCLPKG